jgi:hypothetical protein
MPEYKVLVSPATNPGAFSAELPFSSLRWSEVLNEVGECAVTVPLRGAAQDILKGTLGPGKSCLWIDRGGTLLFGGLIWTVSGDVDANSLEIAAADFHSYVRRREIRSTVVFNAVDQLTIARTLISNIKNTPGSLEIIGTSGTNLSGRLRDRTYLWYERLGVA